MDGKIPEESCCAYRGQHRFTLKKRLQKIAKWLANECQSGLTNVHIFRHISKNVNT